MASNLLSNLLHILLPNPWFITTPNLIMLFTNLSDLTNALVLPFLVDYSAS